MIKDIYDQIATESLGYLGYQKTKNFITWNYCWLELKKMISYYIQNNNSQRYIKVLQNWYNGLLKSSPIIF